MSTSTRPWLSILLSLFFAGALFVHAAGQTWTESSTGPAGDRNSHSMVWDSANERMLLFGGWDGNTFFNDLWSYDPTTDTWTEVTPTGTPPVPRAYAPAVWDSVNEKMVFFGGLDVGFFVLDDVWSYKAATNKWIEMPNSGGPPATDAHAVAFDPLTTTMFVAGGFQQGTRTRDLWAYSTSSGTWSKKSPMPMELGFHTAVFDPETRTILVFGGSNEVPTIQDKIFSYDVDSDTWTTLNPATIGPRHVHAAVWDTFNHGMMVFGGVDGNNDVVSDLWFFDPAEQVWVELAAAPMARHRTPAAWDPVNGILCVYGGNNAGGFSSPATAMCYEVGVVPGGGGGGGGGTDPLLGLGGSTRGSGYTGVCSGSAAPIASGSNILWIVLACLVAFIVLSKLRKSFSGRSQKSGARLAGGCERPLSEPRSGS